MRFMDTACMARLPTGRPGKSRRVTGRRARLSAWVRPLCTATSIRPDQRQSPPRSRRKSSTAELPPVSKAWLRAERLPWSRADAKANAIIPANKTDIIVCHRHPLS